MFCESENTILTFIGFFFLTVIIYAKYPKVKDTLINQLAVHIIPLTCIGSYIFYEYKMLTECPQMNIRIDVFLIWPIMITMVIMYIKKLALKK